ncbi:MAG: carbohydrate ABC transporter substrate-binding protein [Pseudomonadota bacterium]
MTALGLTWDHPRGVDALAEAARRANRGRATPLIEWVAQPLEGFESAPIADLAARHDLLVIDHPHVGEAAAEACLIPIDALYPAAQIAEWARRSVGPSLASYRWQGNLWALPLDVAAQVTARRSEALSAPAASWDEVEEIAARRPVALSLAGPHALLTLFSLCGSAGHVPGGDALLDDVATVAALERMARLHAAQSAAARPMNPIALLQAMAAGELDLVPLVFGYVPYARPGPGRIAFSDPPGSACPDASGGVLGGTGIAFSRRSTPSPDVLAHVASLMTEQAQRRLLPAFSGQPSARAAWTDPSVNLRAGEFYASTLASTEKALLRPRFDGYVAFQTAASHRVRAALAAREDPVVTLSALRTLWRDARARARGALDERRTEAPDLTARKIS